MSFFIKRILSEKLMAIALTIVFFLAPSKHIDALEVRLYNRYQTVENLDFQSFDPVFFTQQKANPESNTDDRYQWVNSTLSLSHRFVQPTSAFFVQAYYSFFWGADNAQNTRENGFGLRQLYFQKKGESTIFTIGRQRIQLDPLFDDYFFSDIVDGIRVQQEKIKPSGDSKIRVQTEILLDVLGNSIDSENLGFFSVLAKDEQKIADFRGDTISARFGLGLKFLPEADDRTWGKFFVYGVRYGASTVGGADISRNGLLADNRSDGDLLTIIGIRLGTNKKKGSVQAIGKSTNLDPFLQKSTQFTLAYSNAKDKKRNNSSKTVTDNWQGWGAMFQFLAKSGGHHATQIALGAFGLGYTGLRGASPGESVLYGPSVFASSPYAGNYHFAGRPLERTESLEKTFLKISNFTAGTKPNNKFFTDVLFLWESQGSQYLGTELTFRYEKYWDQLVLGVGIGVFWPNEAIPIGSPVAFGNNSETRGLAPATTFTLNFNYAYDTPTAPTGQQKTRNNLNGPIQKNDQFYLN